MAKQALKSQMKEPLMENEEDNNSENSEGEEEDKTKVSTNDQLVFMFAGIGGLLSLMVLTVAPTVFVIFPMALNLIISPLVIYNQYQLIKYADIREVNNQMRQDVNKFKGENEKMGESIDELDRNVDRLKGVEEGLQGIVEQQGQNVEELVRLVKEHKETINELKDMANAETAQIFVKNIMTADRDKNGFLDDNDVDNLITVLKGLEYVKTDEDKLRKYVKRAHGNINSVLSLVGTLFKDDLSEEEKIFDVQVILPEFKEGEGGEGVEEAKEEAKE